MQLRSPLLFLQVLLHLVKFVHTTVQLAFCLLTKKKAPTFFLNSRQQCKKANNVFLNIYSPRQSLEHVRFDYVKNLKTRQKVLSTERSRNFLSYLDVSFERVREEAHGLLRHGVAVKEGTTTALLQALQ